MISKCKTYIISLPPLSVTEGGWTRVAANALSAARSAKGSSLPPPGRLGLLQPRHRQSMQDSLPHQGKDNKKKLTTFVTRTNTKICATGATLFWSDPIRRFSFSFSESNLKNVLLYFVAFCHIVFHKLVLSKPTEKINEITVQHFLYLST